MIWLLGPKMLGWCIEHEQCLFVLQKLATDEIFCLMTKNSLYPERFYFLYTNTMKNIIMFYGNIMVVIPIGYFSLWRQYSEGISG